MEITDVRVSLRENPQTRLKGYATITFDHCFVLRNVKIIEGKNGLFVAMPSRKPKVACPQCRFNNDLGGRYCCQCAAPLPRQPLHSAGAPDLSSPEAMGHRDIAHPITAEFRQHLQQKVIEAYDAQKARWSSSAASGVGLGANESL